MSPKFIKIVEMLDIFGQNLKFKIKFGQILVFKDHNYAKLVNILVFKVKISQN